MRTRTDNVVPFGLDANGHVVHIDDLNPLTQYGLRCGLVCPECGEPIEAVRDLSGKTGRLWRCFRHSSLTTCPGFGESAVHRFAKALLETFKGRAFWLPELSFLDASPHTSRYASSGAEVVPHDLLDPKKALSGRFWEVGDFSSLKVLFPDRVVLKDVQTEVSVAPDLRPDALISVSLPDGREATFAFEVRYKHEKDEAAVLKYASLGLGVIEVFVKDLDPFH